MIIALMTKNFCYLQKVELSLGIYPLDKSKYPKYRLNPLKLAGYENWQALGEEPN